MMEKAASTPGLLKIYLSASYEISSNIFILRSIKVYLIGMNISILKIKFGFSYCSSKFNGKQTNMNKVMCLFSEIKC